MMNLVQLGRIQTPLLSAYEYLISASSASNQDDRAFYQSGLVRCLKDAADNAGFKLVPKPTEAERNSAVPT